MKQEMLINAVHPEQKRMANVENGKLIEFNIQMSFKEPIIGNIYKGVVLKVERGLQAAFVDYGGKKDGFLPLRDVGSEYFTEQSDKNGNRSAGRPSLKSGQEVLVQVLREAGGQKGALLTSYISLPGRYLVLMPNKQSSGVSRKIEDESDRKRLKEVVEQIKKEEGIGFIVRTAGMNRTKQELSRDYHHLLRLWQEIQKKIKSTRGPALLYQEGDFGVRTLRDYFTPEITEIWVDDSETFKKMRAYCKAVAPRNLKIIKPYREKTPIFDKYNLEDQIRTIYQERVELKSGGYIIIKPTEAMITIDVNSGRASHKRNVEETAFKTNTEAAEEIARQLRLRDLGGLIAIDFIDMEDRKNIAEVEKTFKKALSIDRSRIQMARISKFGILELSRQKKHSTIQEISYTSCPYCQGSGSRPSLEYTALSAFRKLESQAVKGTSSSLKVSLPYEIANYLLNQKRTEISKLETDYEMAINISGIPRMAWDDITIEAAAKKIAEETPAEKPLGKKDDQDAMEEIVEEILREEAEGVAEQAGDAKEETTETPQKKSRRRRRGRRKKSFSPQETYPVPEMPPFPEAAPDNILETIPEIVSATIPPLTFEAASYQASEETTGAISPIFEEPTPASKGVEDAADFPPEPAKPKRRMFPWRRKKKTTEEAPASDAASGEAGAED